MKYTVHVTEKKEVAEGTLSLHFEKPEDFSFIAGQFIELTLISPPETDAEGNTRAFSIIQAPHEEDLAMATRLRDTAFKRVFQHINIGTPIELEGPFGNFILHENIKRPAIFLVGGIGITPFMSMIKDSLRRETGHVMHLFYSNRRPEDAAFLSELMDMSGKHSNFKLIATMTNMEKSEQEWNGEIGYITNEMIDRHVKERENALYYTAGPATMVSAMRKMLNDAGISNDDIKTEEFSGY